MDKRATKIAICSVACTLIVLFLFLIAVRLSELSCELVEIEPEHLRSSQLNAFNKAKPIRSEDKTILMKFSAYLEYDRLESDEDKGEKEEEKKSPSVNDNLVGGKSVINASATSNSSRLAEHNPRLILTEGTERQQQAKKRFLPLELESIETRHLSDAPNKYKYILSFNCSKMNMVLVRQQERVYVESMSLELQVSNRQRTECELQLPFGGVFVVGSKQLSGLEVLAQAIGFNRTEQRNGNELARYYCNKSLRYSCYYNGVGNSLLSRPIGSPAGLHVGELHINAIEFETPLLSTGNGKEKLKLVSKSEFKSKRSK